MEGIQHRPRDKGRLVVDPKFLNRLVCIGYDHSFISHSRALEQVWMVCDVPNLKNWSVLIRPFFTHSGVIAPKLQ